MDYKLKRQIPREATRGARVCSHRWCFLLPLIVLLLPTCSVIFSSEDDLLPGVDGGAILDTIADTLDSGASADSATVIADGAQSPDAVPPVPPDAALCDPFTESGCYVQNHPLGGPSFEPIGTGAVDSSCTESSDCVSGMFCTGVGGTEGYCLRLCDTDHPCPGAIICLSTDWQGFGFCEKEF